MCTINYYDGSGPSSKHHPIPTHADPRPRPRALCGRKCTYVTILAHRPHLPLPHPPRLPPPHLPPLESESQLQAAEMKQNMNYKNLRTTRIPSHTAPPSLLPVEDIRGKGAATTRAINERFVQNKKQEGKCHAPYKALQHRCQNFRMQ